MLAWITACVNNIVTITCEYYVRTGPFERRGGEDMALSTFQHGLSRLGGTCAATFVSPLAGLPSQSC